MSSQIQTKNLKQIVTVNAKPADVYSILMSSKKHSDLTGDTAKIQAKVGGKFSAYSGGLIGKFTQLIPGKKIVLDWFCETPGWPEDHWSKLTFTFTATKVGTKIVLDQKKIPIAAFKDIADGWNIYYWKPLKEMLK